MNHRATSLHWLPCSVGLSGRHLTRKGTARTGCPGARGEHQVVARVTIPGWQEAAVADIFELRGNPRGPGLVLAGGADKKVGACRSRLPPLLLCYDRSSWSGVEGNATGMQETQSRRGAALSCSAPVVPPCDCHRIGGSVDQLAWRKPLRAFFSVTGPGVYICQQPR